MIANPIHWLNAHIHSLYQVAHPERSHARDVAVPCVIGTVLFKRGASPAGRSAIRACVDDYLDLFGEHIGGGKNGDESYREKSAKGIDDIRLAITRTPSTQKVGMEISNVPDAETAREYHLAVETAEDVHEAKFGLVSCLKFSMPAREFLRIERHRVYQDLLLRICSRLDICGGYGGLSVVLPRHYRRYLPHEYRMARTFAGLEVDADPFAARRLGAPLHFKSVNWYTILGENAIAAIGGAEALHARADDREIEIMPAGNGLLVKAGKCPSLGAPQEGLPAAYVAANRLLRRARHPHHPPLHPNPLPGLGFDQAATDKWIRRFDVEAEVRRSGQRCPETGIWEALGTDAEPRHLAAGDLFPDMRYSNHNGEPILGPVDWQKADSLIGAPCRHQSDNAP
ncbi:type VI immunity family protein [Burkholderia mayonis]|uniref:DUF3396 domain-containing protein n=1 Tax=Burkholderia mayonis TaxID=1385591 RepID=A0A1B4G5U5_9BURK|nr:type VI immunity family protein [Burkholderia mayonis]AOJ11301.1 hypothetical protein WS71_29900 [Burkholderia mayonis]KVE46277.1 hypothetical protein WS71_21070 [Burkholderia mayonis]